MSRGLIVGAVLSAGLLSGGMLMQSGAWREASASTGSPRLLDQVMARLLNDYIDSLPVDELRRRAAFGLVRELEDAPSALLTPERANRLRESTEGRYAGIGIETDLRGGHVTVIAPLAGTPADSAGVRPGDRIVSIDGRPTHGLSMDDVQRALRGPAGSTVTLGVDREGDASATFTLTRRLIDFHPVQRTELLPGRVGYVALRNFSERAGDELEQAVATLREQGAASLLLDVRANPGGLLDQGIAAAELFLDPGQPIASMRGRTPETNEVFTDSRRQRWPDLPIVVLVDTGTASAAEILAGALQDHERAVVMGTPTYGKGSAQSLFNLSGQHVLKLTTALWFTPDGRTIERDSTSGGITPDIVVRPGAAAADSTRPAPGLTGSRRVLTDDAVIARALPLLSGAATPAQLWTRAQRERSANPQKPR